MKAINILKNHIHDLERMVLVFDEYAMYKSRDESKKAIQELTQVIAELEDLEVKDRLAELEKVILDYYLAKGYRIGVGGWGYRLTELEKVILDYYLANFRESMHEHYSQVFIAEVETSKEMFDKAIKHFSLKTEPLQEDVKLELDDTNQSAIYKIAGYESDGRE